MRIRLLLLAPAILLACGDDSNSPGTPDADVLIVANAETMGANAYDPNPFTASLAAGGVVEWGNDDGEDHTVTADDDSFTSGNINGGDTFSHTFTVEGAVPYHCELHPTMVGVITVTP
jgi:plastocyanin